MKTHQQDLCTTLSMLSDDGWRLKASKCQFFQEKLEFLGFELGADGWSPKDQTLQQLLQMPAPQNKTQWRRVRGWMNQLSRFLFNGCGAMEELDKCEKEGDSGSWQKFLVILEEHMVRCSHPVAGEAFSVCVDASGSGWGGCLIQGDKIICCCSGIWERTMRHHRSNVLEIEGLTRALQRFRPFVYGRAVSVYTDNAATFSLKNADNLSDFIRRRLDAILEFCPDIKFIPGKANVVPDFLSRASQLAVVGLSGESSTEEWLQFGHRGHFGVKKTMERIKAAGGSVSWNKVKDHIRRCRPCQRFRLPRKMLPFGVLEDVKDVKQVASIDFIGPLETSTSGVKFIFTYVDHLSRFTVAVASQKADMKTAIRILQKIFKEHGRPQTLLCDSGSYFTTPRFEAFLKDMGIQRKLAPPHCHFSNGLNERLNGNLVNRLRRMLAEKEDSTMKNWKNILQPAVDVINSTKHETTGFQPSFLWCEGRTNEAAPDLVKRARKKAAENFDRERDRVNGQLHIKPIDQLFPLGSMVWVFDYVSWHRHDRKLYSFWKGPYKVVNVVSEHTREVSKCDDRSNVKFVVHIDSLQEYY